MKRLLIPLNDIRLFFTAADEERVQCRLGAISSAPSSMLIDPCTSNKSIRRGGGPVAPGRFSSNVSAESSNLHRPQPLMKAECNCRLDTISSAAASMLIDPCISNESVRPPGDPVAQAP